MTPLRGDGRVWALEVPMHCPNGEQGAYDPASRETGRSVMTLTPGGSHAWQAFFWDRTWYDHFRLANVREVQLMTHHESCMPDFAENRSAG